MKRRTGIHLAAVAALATIGIVVASVPAAAASLPRAMESPIAQPTVEVPLGAPTLTSRSSIFTDVPIPAGITELTIEYGPGVASVDCYMTTGDPEDVIGWRNDAPVAERDVIDVVPGAVVAGARYQLVCRVPGGEDQWTLVAGNPAASTATVTAASSPYLNEIVERFTFARATFTAAPDQDVAFTTAPGTLPAARLFGHIWDDQYETGTGLDGRGSADGSRATATLPSYDQFLYTEDPSVRSWYGEWMLTGPIAVTDGVTHTRSFQWYSSFTVLDAPSAIKLALSSSTATSVQRVKAIIQVIAPLPEPSYDDRRGRIVVKVDGVEVASGAMYASKNGRWTVSLPRLPKGTHVVTAEYSGWTWLAGSVSNRASLRIVL